MGLIDPLTSQRAIAAASAAVVPPLMGGVLGKVPGGAMGQTLVGAGVAIAGATMLDNGYLQSIVVGAGVGVFARGLFGMFLRVNPGA